MVQKAVASFGLVLLVAGLALGIVIAVLEDWVRAALVGADSCAADSETPLGSLGLFTASFRPACAEGSLFEESYSTFKEIESGPTLEFWPLFPAQNSFGGNLGELAEFSSCEETFKEGSAERTAASAAIFSNAESRLFFRADGGLKQIGEAVRAQIFGLTATVDAVFLGLWGASIQQTVQAQIAPALISLTSATALPDAIVSGLVGQNQIEYVGGAPAKIKFFGNFYSVVTESPVAKALFGESTDDEVYTGAAAIVFFFTRALGQMSTFSNETAAASIPQLLAVDGAFRVLNSEPDSIVDLEGALAISERLEALGNMTSGVLFSSLITAASAQGGCLVPNPENTFTDAFPFAATSLDDALNNVQYSKCVIEAAKVTATGSALESLEQLGGFMNLCDLQTGSECIADESKAHIPSDLEGPHYLAMAFFAKYASKLPSEYQPAGVLPSAVDLINVIGAIAQEELAVPGFDLGGSVPEDILPQIPSLVGAAKLCAAGGLNWDNENITRDDTCQAFLVNPAAEEGATSPEIVADSYTQQFSLPDAWSVASTSTAFTPCRAPIAVAAALNITSDVTSDKCYYSDFAGLMMQIVASGATSSDETAAAIIDAAKQLAPVHTVVLFCLSQSIDSRTDCASAFALGGPLLNPFLGHAPAAPVREAVEVQVFEQFYSDITSLEMALEACKDDDLDGEAIERAQVLVPAALASMGVALLLAIALLATEKKALAFASGLLSATGGVLILVGFLGVQAAPVYASVGVDKEAGEAEYSPGLAQILGLVSIAASVIGGCLLAGSACCGNEESDDDKLVAKIGV